MHCLLIFLIAPTTASPKVTAQRTEARSSSQAPPTSASELPATKPPLKRTTDAQTTPSEITKAFEQTTQGVTTKSGSEDKTKSLLPLTTPSTATFVPTTSKILSLNFIAVCNVFPET